MATQYGPASVAITYDASAGGSPQTITPYVREISGIKLEQLTVENHPFGVAYETNTPIGVQKVDDITIKGDFDTTATSGPYVVFGDPDDGPNDSTRTFTFTPGGSKTFTMETRLVSFTVTAQRGTLTEYEAVIRQAGAGAWA